MTRDLVISVYGGQKPFTDGGEQHDGNHEDEGRAGGQPGHVAMHCQLRAYPVVGRQWLAGLIPGLLFGRPGASRLTSNISS
jgi:hypothetical protein